ncbi:dehydrogenase/reductase SDR family member 7-like [Patiria miniata]|uniref:Dehydrogenase/reductase SDR family member 7 n=1 Tax=Patiria miniata TaxID=46514 RepID=A0A914B620_PATMI|nr:dehydrogenase/reductase SDR family member 7-like [Patiria miniata]XP_038071557.1 dehydrogenase/reductase SDR family member 7-like [Patiria miniata]XP_038071558.1 dehydrogenase/reductase SDR family member 7-like [Patiria miniata]
METKTSVTLGIMSVILLFAIPVLHFLAFGLLIYFVVIVTMALTQDGDLLLMLYEQWGQDGSNLRGKVAWITGASSGIGEALSYELARKGVKLILSARREKELERVKQRCVQTSELTDDDVLVLPLDVRDYESHKGCADKALGHFKKVDILVNNAGRSQRSLAVETSLEVDKAVFELNVIGQLSVTKAILPHMLARKEGHIVNISSVAGRISPELSSAYSASKHALMGYFGAFAYENQELCITNVCPGPIESSIVTNAFGKDLNAPKFEYGSNTAERSGASMQTAERCASLIVVAVANKLSEVWICKNIVMILMLMNQWAPLPTAWIKKIVYGNKRIEEFKKSQVN